MTNKTKRRLVEEELDDSELVLEEIPIRVGSQKKYSGTPTTSTGLNGLKGLMPSRGNHYSDEQHEVMMADRGEMAGSSTQTSIMESSHSTTLISSTITSSEIRTIHVNDEMRNDFCGNSIKTTKYEFWNFIPKNLFEQFHRFANCYFMAMALLQTIPGLSPTGRWTSFVPLSVVLLCTMIKDAYEDINRRISDRETNNRVAHVLRNGVFVDIPWKQVKTGDIIKVNNLEQFPCDILIYSIRPMEQKSGENLCYVETSQLDGETNLKIRIANVETSSFTSPRDFENKRMKIECELPNNRLYKFEGTLTMDNGKKIALSPDNICLRGSSLKNTQSILGVAVYTGNDTKFMRNTKKTPHKMSNIERLTNRLVLLVLGVQIFLVTCCDIGLMVWTSEQQPKAWYIFPKARDHDIGFVLFNGFKGFFTILILLTNLIPVSLYVSIEATKLIQGSMISKDLDMYHEETDTRANVRSCALNEDLGQINYIFSDKTGTLTENKMNLLKISINGKIYDITDPQLTNGNWRQSEDSNEILQFLLLLSLCHTVIPERLTETKENQDNTIYHSSSPDEVALVKAAKFLGVEFLDKTTNQANVQILEEFTLKYHLLDCIEFSSERKRQSVIVRNERGEIILYTKGADSVMFPLLSSESNQLPSTLQHIDRFGSTGLRTLVCAMRVLDETEYQLWHEEYEKAKTSLDNRKEKIETVATKIEKDLLLCGATGIEDKLQEGVADTIYNLRLAGINIWVLTGDKMETAINIGFSCELLGSSMKLLKVEGETYDSMERYLTDCLTKLENNSPSKLDNSDVISSEFALVIDGEKLELVFSHQHLIDLFLHVSIKCKSVICCRVSPKQKADIVLLIKKNVESVTLAIGDGANDCNMIQSAHVGIGISGLEGLAAVNVSDYSIAQFRFLKKLLLVHGRWSYRRVSKLVLYCFYKNSVLFLTQMWFIFFNGFSGTSIHDKWNITMYNLLFSGVPIVVFAVLDRDVSSTSASMFPELYFQGRKNRFFNWKVFISWIVNSIFHSLVCFFIPYLTFAESKFPDGQDIDAQTIGIVMYTCAVLVITMKLAIETSTWTWINFFTYGLSLLLWPIYLFLYGSTFQLFRKRAPFVNESYDISQRYRIIFTAQFWLVIMLVVVTCCIRDVFWKWWIRYFQTKKLYYLVQSLQHESITRDHIAHHMPSIDQEEMKPPTVYLKSKILPTSFSNLKEKIISCFGSRRKYAEF